MIEVYQDKSYLWRWRFRAANGRILAESGEGYNNRRDCEAAIAILKRDFPSAPVK